MNKFFSENLEKLRQESKLSHKNIRDELMNQGIYVEAKEISSWFKGKVPESRILKALAEIFSEALKREVSLSELLGNSTKQETKFEFKLFKQDPSTVEIYKGDKYLGSIYLTKDGILLIGDFLSQFRREVESQIKINCSNRPPSVKIKILGGGER